MSTFLLLYERLIPLFEGIEDDTAAEAGSAPGNPNSDEKRKSDAQALRDRIAQLRSEREKGSEGAQKYSLPTKNSPAAQSAPEKNTEEWEQNIPLIPPDADNDKILELTKNLRNNRTYSLEDYMKKLREVEDDLAHAIEEDGDEYSVAAGQLKSFLDDREDWIKSVYNGGWPYELTLASIIVRHIGKAKNLRTAQINSALKNAFVQTKNHIVKQVRALASKQEYVRQKKSGSPQMTQVFKASPDQVMHRQSFIDFMRKLKSGYEMYYPDEPATEEDWQDVEYFLASPSDTGEPFYQIMPRMDQEFHKKMFDRIKKSIAARDARRANQPPQFDPSDQRNYQRSDPNDPTKTVTGPDVTALQRQDQPPSMTKLYTKKNFYPAVDRDKRKFPSWWDFGFKGDFPLSDV